MNSSLLRSLSRQAIETVDVKPDEQFDIDELCKLGLAKTHSVQGWVYYVITKEGIDALAK